MSDDLPVSASGVVRVVLAIATVGFATLGFVVDDDPRFFVASGACGTMWLAWDVIRDYVVAPMGEWLTRAGADAAAAASADLSGETIDDLIQLLERRVHGGGPAEQQVRAAVQLEELYRLVKHDPERAKAVIRWVRAQCAGARELERYSPDGAFLG